MTRKPRWEDDLLTWREHVPEPAPAPAAPDPSATGSTTSAAAPPPTPPIWWPDDPVRPPAAVRLAVPAVVSPPPAPAVPPTPSPCWTGKPLEPFGPPKPDAGLLRTRIPTAIARTAASHLRWLAQALARRGAHAPHMDHGELIAAMAGLSGWQARALTDCWRARLAVRVHSRVDEQVPGRFFRRSVHRSCAALADLEQDNDLYAYQRSGPRDSDPEWGYTVHMTNWASRQPDGGARLTVDCIPRLLELAESVEEAAGLPPQPACAKPRRRGWVLGVTDVIADHTEGSGVALHEALLAGQLAEVHIDLLQGTVTPDPAPHRSMPWVLRLTDWLQQPRIHRDHGWHIAQAHLRRAPGSPTDLLLQVTLETWQGARHAQQERRFRPW